MLDGKGRCFTETDCSSDHQVSGKTDIRSERRGRSLLFQHGAGQQALVSARATRPVEVKVAMEMPLLLPWCCTSSETTRLIGDGRMVVGEEGDYIHIATLSPPE